MIHCTEKAAATVPPVGWVCAAIYQNGYLEILTLAEGDLAPVACLKSESEPCERAAECRTLSVWKDYYRMTIDYFSGITLADLLEQEIPDNYVI